MWPKLLLKLIAGEVDCCFLMCVFFFHPFLWRLEFLWSLIWIFNDNCHEFNSFVVVYVLWDFGTQLLTLEVFHLFSKCFFFSMIMRIGHHGILELNFWHCRSVPYFSRSCPGHHGIFGLSDTIIGVHVPLSTIIRILGHYGIRNNTSDTIVARFGVRVC